MTFLLWGLGCSKCPVLLTIPTSYDCWLMFLTFHNTIYNIPPLTNCGWLWGANLERSEEEWSCNWCQLAFHPLGSIPADALCPLSVCCFKRSYLMSSISRWLLATSWAERGLNSCSTDWLTYPCVMFSKVRSTWLIGSQSYGGNRERLVSV